MTLLGNLALLLLNGFSFVSEAEDHSRRFLLIPMLMDAEMMQANFLDYSQEVGFDDESFVHLQVATQLQISRKHIPKGFCFFSLSEPIPQNQSGAGEVQREEVKFLKRFDSKKGPLICQFEVRPLFLPYPVFLFLRDNAFLEHIVGVSERHDFPLLAPPFFATRPNEIYGIGYVGGLLAPATWYSRNQEDEIFDSIGDDYLIKFDEDVELDERPSARRAP